MVSFLVGIAVLRQVERREFRSPQRLSIASMGRPFAVGLREWKWSPLSAVGMPLPRMARPQKQERPPSKTGSGDGIAPLRDAHRLDKLALI
ncbi:hypothetical protein [Rhizobium sp. 9140]|uniref:hypothetical protein n=1 Tax=Rhizobium sp. 9140 TaxID=1761900 RepID=UPI000A851C1E|nr:hypothetical protein [Rhizobium sp. 9140]